MNLVDSYLAILNRIYADIIKLKEESFVIHSHLLWRNNIRPYNL
jgi:hypothetical protein